MPLPSNVSYLVPVHRKRWNGVESIIIYNGRYNVL